MQSDYSDAIEILERKLASVSSDLELEARKVSQKEAELVELQNKLKSIKIEEESWRELQNREKALQERCRLLETKCMEYEQLLESGWYNCFICLYLFIIINVYYKVFGIFITFPSIYAGRNMVIRLFYAYTIFTGHEM